MYAAPGEREVELGWAVVEPPAAWQPVQSRARLGYASETVGWTVAAIVTSVSPAASNATFEIFARSELNIFTVSSRGNDTTP